MAYPRPIPVGTKVRLTAQVAHLGRAFGIVRVTALNDSGRPCAIATVTTGPVAGPSLGAVGQALLTMTEDLPEALAARADEREPRLAGR